MFRFVILFFCVLGIEALSDKCKITDKECLLRMGNRLFKSLLEVEGQNIDPMFNEMYEGNFADLNFKFINTTITGYKICNVVDCNLHLTEHFLSMEFLCPTFSLKGLYDMYGKILKETFEGAGNFTIDTKSYKVLVNSSFGVTEKNDKKYAQIKHFFAKPQVLGEVIFNFTNLYHGEKEATLELRKAAREHWKDVASIFHDTVTNANFKHIIKTLNYVLKKTPLDDYIEL